MNADDAAARTQLNRSNRTLLLAALAVGVLVIAGVAVFVVVKVTGADERPTGSIETGIEKWAHENGVKRDVDVDCPDPVEWRVGENFHCVMKAGQLSAGVTVTMENDDGYVTWQIEQ